MLPGKLSAYSSRRGGDCTGFAYVEPTIEELNRRIAGGQVFIQSDLSGTYREYYVDPTPFELSLIASQPQITMEAWNETAIQSQIAAQIAYEEQGGYRPPPTIIPIGETDTKPGQVTPVVVPGGIIGAGVGATAYRPGGKSVMSEILPIAVVGLAGIVLAGLLGGSGRRARRRRGR